MHPDWQEVVLGCAAVLAGCISAAACVHVARRTGNWLYYLCGAGAAVFVAGVVGQRTFSAPQPTPVRPGAVAGPSRPGPWDAGVELPLVGVKVTPVALAGLLLGFGGLSVVLFVEGVRSDRPETRPADGRLEEEDSV